MLDILRPVAQLARPLRPTGGHDFARGSLGPKRGVGAASGGGVLCRSHQNVTNVGGDDFDEDDFLRRLRLVTSRVLVADASPSGGGRGQLRRSPFPSLMRLRHPGVKLEHKGHIYFTIVDFFIIQNGC